LDAVAKTPNALRNRRALGVSGRFRPVVGASRGALRGPVRAPRRLSASRRWASPSRTPVSSPLPTCSSTCAARRRRWPGFPIVADGETGYGNAMNVYRTVTEYARAGAAAILIEDQVWPKKCGHYGGERAVISGPEARMKIRAAVDARKERDVRHHRAHRRPLGTRNG